MTINKSQGQSLSHVGIYLFKPVFTHVQLHVTVSRVTSKKGLKMFILDEENRVCIETINGVYRDFFGTFNRSFLMTQLGMNFFFLF